MKTSHTSTIIFLIVCLSSIQSLSVKNRRCKSRDQLPTPPFQNGKELLITPPPAAPKPYEAPTPPAAPTPHLPTMI